MLKREIGRRRGRRGERGVAAVEMALLAPLLVVLLLGVVEASWLLMQSLDVRQASREAGRLAAIDYGNSVAITGEACLAMDDDTGTSITFAGASAALGDDIEITASKIANHLTGLMSWAFPPGMTLSSTATFALEASPPSWTDGSVSC